ncbi:MAG: ABC transporter substrate-binding protein [Myxococcota bacterium]
MVKSGPLLLLGAFGGLFLACSFTTVDVEECADDAACIGAFGPGYRCLATGLCEPPTDACQSSEECRRNLGFGSVCGSAGRCQPLVVPARCSTTFPPELFGRGDAGEHFIVGNLMDRSIESQRARERAAQLAAEQANAEGGLEGRPIGWVFCDVAEDAEYDTLSRTEAALAMGSWLAEDLGVPAIEGPSSSGDTIAVFEALRETRTLVISPSATSPALTGLDTSSPTDDDPGLLWRTAPPDSAQGQLIAEDLRLRGIERVAVINEIGPYGDELARVFEEAFGGPLISSKYSEQAQIAEVATEVGVTPDLEEVIFVSSQADHVVTFLNAAALNPAFDEVGLFLTDSAASVDLFAADDARFAQVRGSRPQRVSNSIFTAFASSYAAAFSGEDVTQFSFAAQAYDAAWLILYGAASAYVETRSEVTGAGIARGLRKISDPAGTPVELRGSQWPRARQVFREGGTLNVSGASGELDYDPATEETTAAVEVWRIVPDCEGAGFTLEGIETGVTPPRPGCG